MLADPPTTITIPTSVAKRLRTYKSGGRSFADVLEDLMDAVPPREFLEWALQELERPAVTYSSIRRTLGVRPE
jgi:predicted CopG family antitoxin